MTVQPFSGWLAEQHRPDRPASGRAEGEPIVGAVGIRRSNLNGLVAGDRQRDYEGRVLPLDESLAQIIERRWTDREYQFGAQSILSTYVFHCDGKPIGNFTRAWRRACARAKVPGTLFHDLRRSAVRDMIRSGVSQHVAMAIAGHKTASMFQRYNVTSVEDKLDALRRRQAYLETRSSRSNVVALRDHELGQTLGQPAERGSIS